MLGCMFLRVLVLPFTVVGLLGLRLEFMVLGWVVLGLMGLVIQIKFIVIYRVWVSCCRLNNFEV